jgi:hypothetical protein
MGYCAEVFEVLPQKANKRTKQRKNKRKSVDAREHKYVIIFSNPCFLLSFLGYLR